MPTASPSAPHASDQPVPEQQREARNRRLGGRLIVAAVGTAVVVVPLALLLVLVQSRWDALARLDQDTAVRLTTWASQHGLVGGLDTVATLTTPWLLRGIAAIVVVVLWLTRRRRLAFWLTVTMVVGGALGILLKTVTERARPVLDAPVAHAAGYSFPSGHALNSMLFAGAMVVLLYPVLRGLWRLLLIALAAALVLLTGFDRLALGVHFVSDVLGGWLVALAVLCGTVAAFATWRRSEGMAPATPDEGLDPAQG